MRDDDRRRRVKAARKEFTVGVNFRGVLYPFPLTYLRSLCFTDVSILIQLFLDYYRYFKDFEEGCEGE